MTWPLALHSPQIAAPTSGDGSWSHLVSPDSHWGHLVLAKSSQAGHFSPVKGGGAVGPRVSARLCLHLAHAHAMLARNTLAAASIHAMMHDLSHCAMYGYKPDGEQQE